MKKPQLIWTGLVILALITGYFIGRNNGSQFQPSVNVGYPAPAETNNMSETRAGGYKFTNPLLECDNFHPSRLNSLVTMEAALKIYLNEQYTSGVITHASVYFRSLNGGPWIGINENEDYSPASLLKVPIMIAVLKKAESDPSLLKQKILHDRQMDPSFKPNIKDTLIQVGKSYTIDELLLRMIKFSDNEAKEMLIRVAGDEFIVKVMEEIGVRFNGSSEDFVSVKEYSSFFRLLYNATYLNREMSEKALSILSHTHFNDGIPAGLPPGISVSHKFGERGLQNSNLKQLHDCGIVYLPDAPYLVCVMTKGDDFQKQAKVIAAISSIVYQNVAGK